MIIECSPATPNWTGSDAAKRFLSWNADRQDRTLAILQPDERLELLFWVALASAPRYEGKGRACPQGCTCGRHNWRERP